MRLDISDQERVLLLELLEAKNTAMYHELHHTDAREYRDYVRRKIDVLEGLKSRVEGVAAVAGTAA
jgi:hypothetical protein